MSLMSENTWGKILKKRIGQKIFLLHSEGDKVHALIGWVSEVFNDAVGIKTDENRVSWIKLDTIVKVKEK